MINKEETERILDIFFRECFQFWRHSGSEEREAFENALQDIKGIKRDPNSPCGDLLDDEAKQKFIFYREVDLGMHRESIGARRKSDEKTN